MSPIYEFKCTACNAPKPVSASMSEDVHSPICDNCMIPMARDYSAPGIIFKGEGWGGSK